MDNPGDIRGVPPLSISGRYVYCVMTEYDYEGERLHSVFESLAEARRHRPTSGDRQFIRRVAVGVPAAVSREFDFVVSRG